MLRRGRKISLIMLFIGAILLIFAFVFNHQSVTALSQGTGLNFFGLMANSYLILDLSYVFFGIAYFLPVFVFVIYLIFNR